MELQFDILSRDNDILIFEPQKPFIDTDELIFSSQTLIKVLVVLDGSISFDNAKRSFGIGRFIEHLRSSQVGEYRFLVDIATRIGHSGDGDPALVKYKNFTFDMQEDGEPVLNKYHELFLFGIDYEGAPSETGPAEPEVLHEWMNQGGGVFATGDHATFGAAMCSKIPRIGTMRKWTSDDDVPSGSGLGRIETVQPATESQRRGESTIGAGGGGSPEQEDSVPQSIDWIPYATRVVNNHFGLSTSYIRDPHPILCHPELGPIDVMPDHAHEGCCTDIDEINLTANEYPTFNGYQPKPRVIANGNVVSRPNYGKREVNPRTFPMISAYDGRENNSSGTGRVVVDSTWHHWFNLNLWGLEEAPDKTNWRKISRYFLNVATWIAPESITSTILLRELMNSHHEAPGVEEITEETGIVEVGYTIFDHLSIKLGPCEVMLTVQRSVCEIWPEICDIPFDDIPFPVPGPSCLSCPPPEIIIYTYLGSAYRATESIAYDLNKSVYYAGEKFEIKVNEIKSLTEDRVIEELRLLGERFNADVGKMQNLFEKLR